MPRGIKSPSLSLGELRHLQWLLGCLLSVLAAGTVLFLEVEAWGLLFAVILSSVVAALRPGLPARVPRLVHVLVVPVVVLILGFDLWQGQGLLASLTRLSLLLLLYRSVCYRRRREDLQLILLGLFLIVVAGVLTVSLAFAVLLVLFCLCSLALLLVVTVADAIEPPGEPQPGPARVPSWALRPAILPLLRRLLQVLDWRQGVAALLLFLFLVCGSAAIFVVIPRFQLENSVFLERLFPRKVRTGFSDAVRFGEVTDITQDSGVALSIDVPDGVRLEGSPYLRLMVLDDYVSDGGFRLSTALRTQAYGAERSSPQLRGTFFSRTEDAGVWTFYLEPGVSRHLPMAGPFRMVQFREIQTFRHAPRLNLISLRNDPLSMVAYRVEHPSLSPLLVDPDFEARLKALPASARSIDREGGRLMLALPLADSERALLHSLIAPLKAQKSPAAFAEAAVRLLQRDHAYSLQSAIPDGEGDVLVRWLAGRTPGHCEFFAGSFVLLARAAGYPCRMVVGFRGGSWNGYSNNLVVRNSDAHAWCELWDGHGAWLRVDPTPGAQLPGTNAAVADVRESRMDRSWSARFDSYRIFWYRRIVNFDQQAQVSALLSTKDLLNSLRQALMARTDDMVSGLRSRYGASGVYLARLWLFGIAFLLAAAGASWAGLRLYRNWKYGRGLRGRRLDAVRREAGRLLASLDAFGSLSDPDLLLRGRLERLRYGPPDASVRPLELFNETRRRLRSLRSGARRGGRPAPDLKA